MLLNLAVFGVGSDHSTYVLTTCTDVRVMHCTCTELLFHVDSVCMLALAKCRKELVGKLVKKDVVESAITLLQQGVQLKLYHARNKFVSTNLDIECTIPANEQ